MPRSEPDPSREVGRREGAEACEPLPETIPDAGRPDAARDVTTILVAIDQGDPQAAGKLLPLVYDELRKLAAARLASEAPGQTLDATALVHEAYMRLVSPTNDRAFANRKHFFVA